MAKLVSLSGAIVGKIGGNVYSVNAGQQIVRAYQPNVANPSTEPQVTTRSKFKLASQLSAAVAPVLAIKKVGLVSGRNQFVSQTMGIITEEQGVASVPLEDIQLTKSSRNLPPLTVSRGESNVINIELSGNAATVGVSRVVYSIFYQPPHDNAILLTRSLVISEAGVAGKFATEVSGINSATKIIIYAYGVIEEESGALAKYSDYQVDNASFIASLISSRSAAANSLSATITRSYILEGQS